MARFVPYQTYGRGSSKAFLVPTEQTVNSIAGALRWAESTVPSKFPYFMNLLCQQMALINQGFARKMSFGPYDPGEHNPNLAWLTPEQGIRRISQRYYLGWKVRQKGEANWILYNDSREAYFIEFGISQVGGLHGGQKRYVPKGRIRRPVRKLSLMKTLRFLQQTKAADRIWFDIYLDPAAKNNLGRGFTQIVQSGKMGTFQGPLLGRYLP